MFTGINKISSLRLDPKAFMAIIILLHVIGFMIALSTGSIYLVDSIDYLSQAENLVKHGSLYAAPWNGPYRPDYFTFRPPVYGFMIALIKLVYDNNYLILFFQAIISISTIISVRNWIRKEAPESLRNQHPEGLLLLLLILYPSQIIHCNFVMSDILFQALLFHAFKHTWRFYQQPNIRHAWACSLFFILAMLTKPVAFLIGICLLAFFLVRFLYLRYSLKLLLPLFLLPLSYHAYCLYNKHITGHYHFSTVTPIFVLKYMGKYTNAQIYGEAYADSVQEVVMKRADTLPLPDRYNYMNEAGKAMIANAPLKFALFNVKGFVAFFIDPGRFEWVHFLNLSEGNFLGLYHVINTQGFVNGIINWVKQAPILLLLILLFCLFANLFITWLFLRFILQNNSPIILRLLILFFVGYIVLATGVLGLSRYRIAVAPMLWLAAVIGLKKNASHS